MFKISFYFVLMYSCTYVGQGIGLIVIGLIFRISVSYLTVLKNGFSWLEMCFVAIAWLPKATVQVSKFLIVTYRAIDYCYNLRLL